MIPSHRASRLSPASTGLSNRLEWQGGSSGADGGNAKAQGREGAKSLLSIPYKGHILASPLRNDLIVSGLVIVECKAVSQYNTIFEAQTLTYSSTDWSEIGNGDQLRRTCRQERHPSCRERVMSNHQRKGARTQRRNGRACS
ncbi:MAG: GxxExxY protein, partial [Pirellulales bacterium]